jgi:hypothetical protein
MGPSGLGLKEVGIKELSAVIIQGADQNPFFLGIGRPEMMRSVVLDERSNGRGQNLPIMEFLLGTFLIATQGLRPGDDRGHRDSNPLLEQPVSDGRVVVTRDRKILILDESLLVQECLLNRPFRGVDR